MKRGDWERERGEDDSDLSIMQLPHAMLMGAGVLPTDVANPLNKGTSPFGLRTTSPTPLYCRRLQIFPMMLPSSP